MLIAMALQPGDPGTRVCVGRAAGAAYGARARLEAGRAEILERHRAGAGGQEVVRSISALTDDVVQAMFAGISGELQGAAPPRVALIATGGYGRRELSPRSDVDLLALLPGEDASAAERKQADAAAERLHRALWDAGLEAGFAARTLGQTLKLAREDHTARTALLDCRLVCGEPSLFKDLERTMVTELEARKVEEFIQEKLEELQVRRKRYGGSVWLLEPHLKQGKGGLRDLQAALWIARVRHKVAGLGEAGERGLLPAREVKEARAARDLLWRLRNELHYATGRRDDREVFARRPADLMRIFAVAETYGAQVYSYARNLLVQELQRLGPGLAADRDAHFEFWQILMREGSEGQALAPIHELGLLGALFPEVGRLRARAQHSLYHVYTVDTHTVFALQRLMRLRAGGLADVEPELTRIARAQQRPLALMLGLLFHDLGKGLGPDHSARGAELVRAYAQRISLDPGDAADVEWLVLAHLKMSHLSQRRDLEDMALIESFARELRTVERLEMLYLLTYADMASVSAENWTEWKARLLRLLYEKAHATLLAEELDQPAHAESLELRRERLARAIEPLLDEPSARKAVPEFTRALPERYAAIVRPADAARHLKLWLLARRSGSAAELRQPESGEAELTLVAPDRPGLLALFSAALAANGIDILAAEVNSLEDGIALDRFIVREPGGGAPAQGRWEAAHADLLRLLSGAEDPHRLVQRRLRRASWAASAAPAVETKVRVDNVSSADCTILDVFTQDRPGLLHAIADALHRAGASIEVARIATEGNRATDAFYLREAAGRAGARKIGSDDRLRELQAAVAAAIAELAGRS